MLVLLAIGIAAILPGMFRSLTNAMLFYPTRGQDHTPAAVGLEYDELWITAEDGTRTQCWWMPYQGPPTRALGVTVLAFHGNAGTISHRLDFHRQLHDLGASVMAAEYRGYGDSEGRPSEEGLSMDAVAALASARARAEARGDAVIVHGRSLGGAVAIRLAADAQVDGLIVESTFTSLTEMAARSGIPLARHLVSYDFESLALIGEADAPVMIVHGEDDELIPFSMGERLRDRARTAGLEVDWFPVPGGTHNDTWHRAGPGYWTRLRGWLESLGHPGAPLSPPPE